jgi:dethiobiotin synthetase
MPGLFVTGTDTGVGKTVITAGVARLLRKQGRKVDVRKPVATGAAWVDGRWLSEDTIHLAHASGCDDLEAITRWSFPEPAAPPVAARRQGVELQLHELAAEVSRQHRPGAALLVEGVGGLLCPLTSKETIANLAEALGLPLLIVARRALGTLNHTLLTLEVARGRGLRVAGVVVNETTPPEGLADTTNVEELRQRIEVPLLAVVCHQPDPWNRESAGLASVDWWGLCHS